MGEPRTLVCLLLPCLLFTGETVKTLIEDGHHNLFCPRFYRMCAYLEASSPHELSSRFDSFHFDREVVNGELASTWFWSKVVWIVLTNSDDPINRLRDPKDPLQLHL